MTDRTRLGDILISGGWCDASDVTCAVERQARARTRLTLGAMLVAAGLLTSDDVERAAAIQRRLRSRHLSIVFGAASELSRYAQQRTRAAIKST